MLRDQLENSARDKKEKDTHYMNYILKNHRNVNRKLLIVGALLLNSCTGPFGFVTGSQAIHDTYNRRLELMLKYEAMKMDKVKLDNIVQRSFDDKNQAY